MTVFLVVVFGALLVLAGLVVDGGATLAARQRADDEAEQAARAGAQALSIDALRAQGDLTLDPEGAVAAAQSYLGQTGHESSVSVFGDSVDVSVSFSQPMRILGIGGIWSLTVTGHGRARARGALGTEAP